MTNKPVATDHDILAVDLNKVDPAIIARVVREVFGSPLIEGVCPFPGCHHRCLFYDFNGPVQPCDSCGNAFQLGAYVAAGVKHHIANHLDWSKRWFTDGRYQAHHEIAKALKSPGPFSGNYPDLKEAVEKLQKSS